MTPREEIWSRAEDLLKLAGRASRSQTYYSSYEDAEDVVQDVALYALERADKYDPERAKLSTWLYVSTLSCLHHKQAALHATKRGYGMTTLGDEALEDVAARIDLEEDVVERLDQEAAIATILKAAEKLTEKQRDVLLKRYLEEITLDTLAAEYGLSRQRICQILAKAERVIRAQAAVRRIARTRYEA